MPCYDALPIKAAYLSPPERPSAPGIDVSVKAASMTAYQKATAQAAPPNPLAASSNSLLIIQRSRDAIGSFASPKPFAKAPGAEFAWADDNAENEVWLARGIVAASFVHKGQMRRDDPYIKTVTLAPYIDFDRVSNSTKVTADVDNLITAAWWRRPSPMCSARRNISMSVGRWSQAFQGKPRTGRSISNGNLSAAAILKAETQSSPIWARRNRSAATSSSPPALRFRPSWNWAKSAPSRFSLNITKPFRAGPAVTRALDGIKEFDYVPWWIRRIHYEINYSWLYDFLSGRDYELLDTSLTFALDPQGHLGLTFGYRNGELEATGQDVDLATIALSVSY